MKEQGLETRKLRKLFAKEEEEELQRDSKVVKEYMKKLLKCKSRKSFFFSFILFRGLKLKNVNG